MSSIKRVVNSNLTSPAEFLINLNRPELEIATPEGLRHVTVASGLLSRDDPHRTENGSPDRPASSVGPNTI